MEQSQKLYDMLEVRDHHHEGVRRTVMVKLQIFLTSEIVPDVGFEL
jgi:hypothetical protein